MLKVLLQKATMALPELNMERSEMGRVRSRKHPRLRKIEIVVINGESKKVPIVPGSRRKRDPRKHEMGRKRVQESKERSQDLKKSFSEKFDETCGLLDTGFFGVSEDELREWQNTYPSGYSDMWDDTWCLCDLCDFRYYGY